MGGKAAKNKQHKRQMQRWERIHAGIREARCSKGYGEEQPVLPVVVGGTMMYLQWLVHGRPDAAAPTAEAVRIANEIVRSYETNDDWDGAVHHVVTYGKTFQRRIDKLCGKDWYRLRRTLKSPSRFSLTRTSTKAKKTTTAAST